ncbi:MAG: type II toxin-antitoxin system VapC family toxin [Planctomycetia bacterium]|nr:type II toxin-antitoxin system VapC family toxin [Planctomycetia bacterium]
MTSLLLDTHAFLWFVWNHPRLSGVAKSLIEEPRNLKLISLAACWEIAIKSGSGKLQLGEPCEIFLPREIARNNFKLLTIDLTHVVDVETLPRHHGDPFDRLLVAQSLREELTLLSADPIFDRYGVTRVW